MITEGNIVDLENERIYYGELSIRNGIISSIKHLGKPRSAPFIMPGFIDAHVHIESSMLVPTEFSKLAAVHGTIATVSDPHEIANVLGVAGVEFMIENAKEAGIKFFFGAPSCVPATDYASGARIDLTELEYLLRKPEIIYLAEMMNYPSVISGDQAVHHKLALAKSLHLPIDGHAPGLLGEEMRQYFSAGISTDHECFTYEEGLQKAQSGVKILIREGSAAKNYSALEPLLRQFPNQVMFCSDDKHPDDLKRGHINDMVKRAIGDGHDVLSVLRASSLNPILHYQLPVGKLALNDPADFIVVDNLSDFRVLKTYVHGSLIAEHGNSKETSVPLKCVNNFQTPIKTVHDFTVESGANEIVNWPVIQAIDKQLITERCDHSLTCLDNKVQMDLDKDILKITVVNRYGDRPVCTAFIQGFGLRKGAIASSVAHDSHNVVAVGTSDEALCRAVNLIITSRGGIAAISDQEERHLPLPIAGIMSNQTGDQVASAYESIDQFAREELGSCLSAPFMTLSFMALLVIPKIKMSDLGLFDAEKFAWVKV